MSVTVAEFRLNNYDLVYDQMLEISKAKQQREIANFFGNPTGNSNTTNIEENKDDPFLPADTLITSKQLKYSTFLRVATLVAQVAVPIIVFCKNPARLRDIPNIWLVLPIGYNVQSMAECYIKHPLRKSSLSKKVNDFFHKRAPFLHPERELIFTIGGQIFIAGCAYLLARYNWIYFSTPYVGISMTIISNVAALALMPIVEIVWKRFFSD